MKLTTVEEEEEEVVVDVVVEQLVHAGGQNGMLLMKQHLEWEGSACCISDRLGGHVGVYACDGVNAHVAGSQVIQSMDRYEVFQVRVQPPAAPLCQFLLGEVW